VTLRASGPNNAPRRKGLSTEASRPGYFALLFASSRTASKISSTLRSNSLAARTTLMQGAVHLVIFAAFLFLTLVP
jgi:hypothetical protein